VEQHISTAVIDYRDGVLLKCNYATSHQDLVWDMMIQEKWWRYDTFLLSSLLVAILILAMASAVDTANPDATERAPSELPSPELAGGWHFVRTRNPHGGADAISIMHTADTSRSDLDLAGFVIRCSERGTEAVIVLIRTFPLRARLHVVFGKPGNETRFEATVAPPGTSILISGDATPRVRSSWQDQSDLFIRVEDGDIAISGVVPLAGLQAAFKILATSCPTQ
jgi:hypothetical protein